VVIQNHSGHLMLRKSSLIQLNLFNTKINTIKLDKIRVEKMAKVKGTKKRTRAKHAKPGSKRGRGVKH